MGDSQPCLRMQIRSVNWPFDARGQIIAPWKGVKLVPSVEPVGKNPMSLIG
jgi:hypothetical protein